MCDIAFFLPSTEAGGAERVSINLMNKFAEEGFQVELWIWRTGGEFENDVSEDVTRKKVNPIVVPGYRVLGIVPSLIKLFHEEQPEAIISAMNHVNVPVAIGHYLSSSDSKLILTEHNNPAESMRNSLKNKIVYQLAKVAYQRADKIVAVSNGVADDLSEIIGIDRDDIDVVYNPVVTNEVMERQEGSVDDEWLKRENVILAVGNLRKQKDFSMLIEAFSEIRLDQKNLIIVGDGPQKDTLKKQIEDLGLNDSIRLAGYVENVYAYMSSADVFALSSRWEGLPTVLIEALACGCPVVATDCPSGPSEIVTNPAAGSLVPVGDTEAFAEALRKSLRTDYETEEIRAESQQYTPESAYKGYKRVLGI